MLQNCPVAETSSEVAVGDRHLWRHNGDEPVAVVAIAGITGAACQNNACGLFVKFSRCLSRACLGKMIILDQKWTETPVVHGTIYIL